MGRSKLRRSGNIEIIAGGVDCDLGAVLGGRAA
jgi:hypothetical protein